MKYFNKKISLLCDFRKVTLREKCPNTMFFWSLFSRIWSEYGDLLVFSPNAGKYGPEKLCIWTIFTQC